MSRGDLEHGRGLGGIAGDELGSVPLMMMMAEAEGAAGDTGENLCRAGDTGESSVRWRWRRRKGWGLGVVSAAWRLLTGDGWMRGVNVNVGRGGGVFYCNS